jgi:hypothetical protein
VLEKSELTGADTINRQFDPQKKVEWHWNPADNHLHMR